jgi:hypothetical protein
VKGRDRDFVLYSVLSIQFSFSMSIALSVGEEYPGSVFLTFNVLRSRGRLSLNDEMKVFRYFPNSSTAVS